MFLINLILVSVILYTNAIEIKNQTDVDYIECYWCNSRDPYCGKRVIDTMVSTVKCPKQSRCVVYTNPYDNYFLHRGCTYGMDLGEMVVQNGCYVEEEGATYCFCDFNRCNAAGILDLRNLIDDNNSKEKAQIKKKETTKDPSFERYLNREDPDLVMNHRNQQSNKSPVLSSYSDLIKPVDHQKTSINPMTKYYNKLLSQYLSYSNHKNTNFANQEKISNQLNQTFHQNNKNQELIKKFHEYTNFLKNSRNQKLFRTTQGTSSKIITPTTTAPRSILPIEILKHINKLSTKFSTKKLTSRTPILSTSTEIPLLYKLKINDTFSKSLLDDPIIRNKLGVKPNEHLSILIKNPLENQINSEFKVTSIPNDNKNETQPFKSEFSTTTMSWLSKLKAKLSQALSSTQSTYNFINLPFNNNALNLSLKIDEKTSSIPRSTTTTITTTKTSITKTTSTTSTTTSFTPSTTSINEWTHVLSDSYKQSLTSLNFKCSKDGLFAHPKDCSKFLQCVDFGTYYERFYVQNCPNGLYFNHKLELCDYLSNVACPQNQNF